MNGYSKDKIEPTCRICYLGFLPNQLREQLIFESVGSCIYYCEEHQALVDTASALVDWSIITKDEKGSPVVFKRANQ